MSAKHRVSLSAEDFLPEPSEAAQDLVVPRTIKSKEINILVPEMVQNPRTPQQIELDLQIQKQVEIDGIGMGVLSDGTAFLTCRCECAVHSSGYPLLSSGEVSLGFGTPATAATSATHAPSQH